MVPLALAVIANPSYDSLLVKGGGSTLPSRLYQDVANTYSHTAGAAVSYTPLGAAGGSCRLMNWSSSCSPRDTDEPRLLDWAALDWPLSPDQYAAYPDLHIYPTAAAAVVPIYNLPNATEFDPPLVLTLDVLSDIFRSAITRWDDPRIAATNLALSAAGRLPAAGVVVVVPEEAAGLTYILRQALANADPAGFGRQLGISAGPGWANATVLPCASGALGGAPCVNSTAFSIGYASLAQVSELSVPAVSIFRSAGVAVAATVESLAAALDEPGLALSAGAEGPSRLTLDISNAAAANAWPLSGVTYVVLRTRTSLFTAGDRCQRARQVVNFWRWYYTSDVVQDLASAAGHATLPVSMRQVIGDRILFDAECDGKSLTDSIANPLSLIPVIRGIVNVSATVLLLLICAATALFIRYRKSSAVKSAQPFFLLITAAGCALSIFVVFLADLDHTGRTPDSTIPVGSAGRYPDLDAACGAQVWLTILGASLMYAPLVAKLWRVTKVMINPSMRRVKLPPHKFYAAVGGVVLLDVALLSGWQATAPPFYSVRVYPPLTAADVETWHGSCVMLPPGSNALAVALFAKQLSLFLFGLSLCYKSRHMDNEYSDAKVTFFVLAGQLERMLAGLIAIWIVHPSPPNGSPAGLLVVKWLLVVSGPVAIIFFLFASRLNMLRDNIAGVPPHSVWSRPAGQLKKSGCPSMRSRQSSGGVSGEKTKHGSSQSSGATELSHTAGPGARVKIAPRLEGQPSMDSGEACSIEGNSNGSAERKRLGERIVLAPLHAKVKGSIAGRNAELEEELTATKAELIHLTGEMDDMRDDMSDLRERNHLLQAQLAEMKSGRFGHTAWSSLKSHLGSSTLRSANAGSVLPEGRNDGKLDRQMPDSTPAISPLGRWRMALSSPPDGKGTPVK
mmetsp:Transcript_34310/g.110776  ORF Transcript_34310/g.110776 Transcript_34310/m.110776 type:complete len:905 (-) Transcript_34310:202-2916(-)